LRGWTWRGLRSPAQIALAPDGSLFVVYNGTLAGSPGRVADVYLPGSTMIARSMLLGAGGPAVHVSIDAAGRVYVPSGGAVNVYESY
jgi:hypothetical protein